MRITIIKKVKLILGILSSIFLLISANTALSDEFSEHFETGKDYLEKGEIAAAITEFKESIKVKPTSIEPHFYLGEAYERLGNLNEATKEYNRVIELAPVDRYDEEFNNLSEDIKEEYNYLKVAKYKKLREKFDKRRNEEKSRSNKWRFWTVITSIGSTAVISAINIWAKPGETTINVLNTATTVNVVITGILNLKKGEDKTEEYKEKYKRTRNVRDKLIAKFSKILLENLSKLEKEERCRDAIREADEEYINIGT